MLSARSCQLFDGENLAEKIGFVAELLTVDPSGWPRSALLSVGEVLAPSPKSMRLATWAESRTTNNLKRTKKATLAYVLGEASMRTQLEIKATRDLPVEPSEGHLVVFDAMVREVREDVVPYAVIRTGIAFGLTGNVDEVLQRWEDTVQLLKTIDHG